MLRSSFLMNFEKRILRPWLVSTVFWFILSAASVHAELDGANEDDTPEDCFKIDFPAATPTASAPGWYLLEGLGDVSVEQYPWIYSYFLGWLYLQPDGSGGYILHENVFGWVWSNSEIYPHAYSLQSGNWLQFFGDTPEERQAYNFTAESFFDGEIETSSFPKENHAAEFTTRVRGVSGKARFVNSHTIEIDDFNYDTFGPEARVVISDSLSFDNYTILSPDLQRDEAYVDESMTLKIPHHVDLTGPLFIGVRWMSTGISMGDGLFILDLSPVGQ